MTSVAPGVYTSVVAATPSPNGNTPTGTWLVTGQTEAGPTGVAIPITSMNDYANYLGGRVSYGYLYDSLTAYFHDGGVLAYVSRLTGPSALVAKVTVTDRAMSPAATIQVAAAGAGTWGNTLAVTVAAGLPTGSYTLTILQNTAPIATSPNLYSVQAAVTWAAAQPLWKIKVVITNLAASGTVPNTLPATGTYPLIGGVDDTAGVTETQWTNALNVFTQALSPGQISAPGHTRPTGYENLINKAAATNFVALLDVADSSTATTLTTQSSAIQGGVADASYGALLAPWVIIPGLNNTNPGSTTPIPNRVVPPSAVAAALISLSDQNNTNTCNTPAAGSNGVSKYAIGVTQTYNTAALGKLNSAGIDVLKLVNSKVTLYGYRSLALDPNWVFFNNVRFRMQMIYDFDLIGESFIFDQIDGRGLLFARFAGALAGRLQTYYTDNALYGATAADSFSVNVGPQVNTPTTIQAGQLNAQIGVVMSPFSETVYILVTKYLLSTGLPA